LRQQAREVRAHNQLDVVFRHALLEPRFCDRGEATRVKWIDYGSVEVRTQRDWLGAHYADAIARRSRKNLLKF